MDKEKWKIFLSLQGNDEKTPEPSKDIVTSLDEMNIRLSTHYSVFNYFNQPEYKKILVIGAGSGSEVKSFVDKGYDTTGIALHWSDKKFAKNNYNIDLLIEDMHDTNFLPDTFDGVYSYHSLEHSLAPLIVLFEIRRIIRPNGKIFIAVPKSGTDHETGLQHYSVLTDILWGHLLDLVGFKDIRVESPGDTVMKATKDENKECPGKHFKNELIKIGKYY